MTYVHSIKEYFSFKAYDAAKVSHQDAVGNLFYLITNS